MSDYLRFCKLVPFWDEVEFDSLGSAIERDSSEKQNDKQQIRESCCEIYDLSEKKEHLAVVIPKEGFLPYLLLVWR